MVKRKEKLYSMLALTRVRSKASKKVKQHDRHKTRNRKKNERKF